MTSNNYGLYVRDNAGKYQLAEPAYIIATARELMTAKYLRGRPVSSPADAKDFVTLRLGQLEHEVFAVVFLDGANRVIEWREMFRGTISQTSVHPREVVKEALALNAATLLLAHNHPASGQTDPSRADEFLTQTLKAALALVDVRVLDHFIVGGGRVFSFAEHGLL